MKISVFGLLPFSQLIEEGFKKLGHTISSENPDLIFSNDPRGYEESLILKKRILVQFLYLTCWIYLGTCQI